MTATIDQLEPALRTLRAGAERWVRMTTPERRALLRAVRETLAGPEDR